MTSTTLLLQGSLVVPDLGLGLNSNGTLNVVLTDDTNNQRMITVLSPEDQARLLQFLQSIQRNA